MLGALPLQEEHTQNAKSKTPSPATLPQARHAAMLRRTLPQLPLLSQLLPNAAKGRSDTARQRFLKKVRKAPPSGAPMTGTRAAAAAAAAVRRAAATVAAAEAPPRAPVAQSPLWLHLHTLPGNGRMGELKTIKSTKAFQTNCGPGKAW